MIISIHIEVHTIFMDPLSTSILYPFISIFNIIIIGQSKMYILFVHQSQMDYMMWVEQRTCMLWMEWILGVVQTMGRKQVLGKDWKELKA